MTNETDNDRPTGGIDIERRDGHVVVASDSTHDALTPAEATEAAIRLAEAAGSADALGAVPELDGSRFRMRQSLGTVETADHEYDVSLNIDGKALFFARDHPDGGGRQRFAYNTVDLVRTVEAYAESGVVGLECNGGDEQ